MAQRKSNLVTRCEKFSAGNKLTFNQYRSINTIFRDLDKKLLFLYRKRPVLCVIHYHSQEFSPYLYELCFPLYLNIRSYIFWRFFTVRQPCFIIAEMGLLKAALTGRRPKYSTYIKLIS